MGKVCRVADTCSRWRWCRRQGAQGREFGGRRPLSHGVVIGARWVASGGTRGEARPRAFTSDPRGASGAQGRCAGWRSRVTWREGCTPHTRVSRSPPRTSPHLVASLTRVYAIVYVWLELRVDCRVNKWLKKTFFLITYRIFLLFTL